MVSSWAKRTGLIVGLGVAVIAAGLTFAPDPSCADSWMPPSPATYESCNHDFRLTVSPLQLQNQLRYFEDKVDGVEPAGQATGAPVEARGRLERRDADGQWSLVWDRPLVNEVGPVSALVSDAGDYVVTFDNWHSVGLGDNVVVLYDARGMVIRSLALTDIVPENYAAALPRSVSSLWWAGDHRIDGGRLILQLRRPSSDPAEDEPRYVEASIDLSSGRVLPLDGPDWRAALEEAGRVRAQQAEAEAIAVTRRRAPLTGPANGDEAAWHAYLREAFYRLDPDWSETHPLVEVLRRPDAGDYDASVAWLAEALNEDHGADDRIMLGSPSQENLTRVLAHLLEHLAYRLRRDGSGGGQEETADHDRRQRQAGAASIDRSQERHRHVPPPRRSSRRRLRAC